MGDLYKINNKIQNLLALASNNPSEEEAKAALLKAQELMLKYHMENPETIEEDKVITACYDLGTREKTEFVLLLSVLCADGFRSKAVNHMQKIFFVGFEPDATAAKEVYSFLIDHSEKSHQEHFSRTAFSEQKDKDWRYGYIVGLYMALNSRKGYEIMRMIPQKVLDTYSKLPTYKQFGNSKERTKITRIDGDFAAGFRTGNRSLSHREIGGE